MVAKNKFLRPKNAAVTTKKQQLLEQVTQLSKENEALAKLLIYYYQPSNDEWALFYKHKDQVLAYGSCPPTIDEFFLDLLLTKELATKENE